jgi:hypothetical protein
MKITSPFVLCSVIGVMAIEGESSFSYLYRVILNHLSDNPIIFSIQLLIGFCGYLFWVIIPIFLYLAYKKYVILSPKKISSEELDSLKKRIAENHQFLEMAETEKGKLNVDKIAESLNYMDYEKYLHKTYG